MTDANPVADPTTLDETYRKVASATGAARASVDAADHGTRHTARQLVYALAQGGAEDRELRALLRELAMDSERLSGDAVRLRSRIHEAENTVNAAAEASDLDRLTAAVSALDAVHADGLALLGTAAAVRRRLPRAYGDPLELDSEWPTAETDADPQREPSDEEDWWTARLRAWVATALDVRAPESRLAALRELVEFIEEAESPGTLKGGVTTLLRSAYELGVESGKAGIAPADPDAYRAMLREPPPDSQRGVEGENVDGNRWAAEYLRELVLSNSEAEIAEPRFSAIREIARLVSEAPASATLQGELLAVLASAYEIGRRHNAPR